MIRENICTGQTLGIAVWIMIILFLLAGGAGASTQITGCNPITLPGTYVLTGDIINSPAIQCINITSSNVVLDGNGFMIDGVGGVNTYGVYVYNSTLLTNVTIRNLNVTDWYYGIYYANIRNGTISGNNGSSNYNGIFLVSSSNNTLSGNTATSNNNDGIYLYFSSNNTLSGNTATSNNQCGIYLYYSSNNTLNGNTATSNNQCGILLSLSSNNTLSGNNASNNGYGISLSLSSNNTLNGNNASNNYEGISLGSSGNNNMLSNNTASNNYNGIFLYESSNNTLSGNNASNNENGITLGRSGNNIIYNNIFNNTNNFYYDEDYDFVGSTSNTWNITLQPGTNIIGGPNLGGNFWSNPAGPGFSQTCTGDIDGICDSPYTLYGNNTDYLPLTYNPGKPVQSSTGQGIVYFDSSAGTIEDLIALNVSDIPEPPPVGVNLPYGLFSFNITGLTPGGSANLTLTFPAPLPPGTTYWKFGPNASDITPHWYDITAAINGNNLTIMLTDGGPGDDDLAANGIIEEPGGPSIPVAPAKISNVTGGGWIVSPIKPAPKNNNKATFGFVAHFVNGMPAGNLEYTDHVSGMKVKGNVTTLSVNKTTMKAAFSGTATINGTGAYVYNVTAVDNGEPGKTDNFAINITSISYMASGTLGGGNIQIRDP